jgi:hypothetical protein
MSNTSTFISKGVAGDLTTLSSSLNLSSFNGGGASSYLVEVGTFNYDAYGNGIAFRKDGGPIDDYINAVISLGIFAERVYTELTFNYGEAQISFTLKTDGTFENVTCPYGAGGYSASSGQIVMLGTQLLGGATPANDILWNYVCAGNDGVITGFTYDSGTPPIGPRDWTFTPSSGTPFTRSLFAPTSNTSLAPADAGADIWILNTADSISIQGTGPDQLNVTTFPDGTSFNISAGTVAGVTNTVNRARFVHCTATSNTTTIRVINESSEILGELYLHSIGDSITIEKAASDSISLISGGVKAHAVGSPRS